MDKKAQIGTIIIFIIAGVLLYAGTYYGTNTINKNIPYMGDTRNNLAYSTSECVQFIQDNIPREDRTAFGSIESVTKEGYTLISCK